MTDRFTLVVFTRERFPTHVPTRGTVSRTAFLIAGVDLAIAEDFAFRGADEFFRAEDFLLVLTTFAFLGDVLQAGTARAEMTFLGAGVIFTVEEFVASIFTRFSNFDVARTRGFGLPTGTGPFTCGTLVFVARLTTRVDATIQRLSTLFSTREDEFWIFLRGQLPACGDNLGWVGALAGERNWNLTRGTDSRMAGIRTLVELAEEWF